MGRRSRAKVARRLGSQAGGRSRGRGRRLRVPRRAQGGKLARRAPCRGCACAAAAAAAAAVPWSGQRRGPRARSHEQRRNSRRSPKSPDSTLGVARLFCPFWLCLACPVAGDVACPRERRFALARFEGPSAGLGGRLACLCDARFPLSRKSTWRLRRNRRRKASGQRGGANRASDRATAARPARGGAAQVVAMKPGRRRRRLKKPVFCATKPEGGRARGQRQDGRRTRDGERGGGGGRGRGRGEERRKMRREATRGRKGKRGGKGAWPAGWRKARRRDTCRFPAVLVAQQGAAAAAVAKAKLRIYTCQLPAANGAGPAS